MHTWERVFHTGGYSGCVGLKQSMPGVSATVGVKEKEEEDEGKLEMRSRSLRESSQGFLEEYVLGIGGNE